MCVRCVNMRQGDVNEDDDDDVNGDDNGRPHHMTDMYFRDLLGGNVHNTSGGGSAGLFAGIK